VAGWSITRSSIDYLGGYWEAAKGSRSIDLEWPSASTMTSNNIRSSYIPADKMRPRPDGTALVQSILLRQRKRLAGPAASCNAPRRTSLRSAFDR
jgi:hypothetical protein